MMQLNAKQSFFIVVSGYLLGSLTLWSNSWGGNLYNLYMRRNIGPAAAGPAGPAATALMTHVTCHITTADSDDKKWQTMRAPTLLCCFIFLTAKQHKKQTI